MELYEKIDKIRKEKNLTKKQLAIETDMSVNTVGGICRGVNAKRISLFVALKIAKTFDMDIHDLIKDTEYDL